MPQPKDPHGNNNRTWRNSKNTIDWSAAPVADLKLAIVAVTNGNGAIMFGRTMDQGALIVSVYRGDERSKEYVTAEADIPALLRWITETYA